MATETAIVGGDPLLIYYQRIRTDPWFFARELVFTKDEADRTGNAIKAFPTHFEYLELYFKLWVKYPLIAIPKSRRMFMTWTNVTLYLWDTMFNSNRRNAFVSKKEADSDDLVERAHFIYDHIPHSKLPSELVPKCRRTFGCLEFPDIGSQIDGYPSGADQLRQFTFSGILADEAAFWDNAREMYSAAIPTLEGGGRMTMLSSPAAGFFKALVFDQIDSI